MEGRKVGLILQTECLKTGNLGKNKWESGDRLCTEKRSLCVHHRELGWGESKGLESVQKSKVTKGHICKLKMEKMGKNMAERNKEKWRETSFSHPVLHMHGQWLIWKNVLFSLLPCLWRLCPHVKCVQMFIQLSV